VCGISRPLRCPGVCAARAARDWVGRPVQAGGDRHRRNVKEVADSAGEAAVGGERDHGSGEIGDGLDGEADRQRGGYAAARVGGEEPDGGEEPGEPQDRFAASAGEHANPALA